MTTGGGDFQRALGLDLALDVGEVGVIGTARIGRRDVAAQARIGIGSGKMRANLQQRVGRKDRRIAYQRRFVGIHARQDEGALLAAGIAGTVHREGHRQRTADRPQFARQRQLAGKFVLVELIGRHLARCRQYAERNRQIEAPGFLGEIGRRQIDRDAACRKLETGVLQRRAYAVLRFFHFGIG